MRAVDKLRTALVMKNNGGRINALTIPENPFRVKSGISTEVKLTDEEVLCKVEDFLDSQRKCLDFEREFPGANITYTAQLCEKILQLQDPETREITSWFYGKAIETAAVQRIWRATEGMGMRKWPGFVIEDAESCYKTEEVLMSPETNEQRNLILAKYQKAATETILEKPFPCLAKKNRA